MNQLMTLVTSATVETLEMVVFSTIFSLALGLPLGVLLCITAAESQGGIIPHPVLNQVLGRIVNVLRSFPFIILMIVLFPLSRIILGTSIGTKAAIVPLSIAAAPFVARVIESALKEAEEKNIGGKEVTPFLLDKVKTITAGKSLASNIELVYNNAKVAAQIAKDLADLNK